MHRRIVVAFFVLSALGGCRARVTPLTGSPEQFCEALDASDYGTAQRILRRDHARAMEAAGFSESSPAAVETQVAVDAVVELLKAERCASRIEVATGVIRTEPPIKKIRFSATGHHHCVVELSFSQSFPIQLRCEQRRPTPMPRPPSR
ncbi:MAG: hypothetical protein IPL79_04415 [Myxococcales bacterium]|nr:hypothetical protein [Myxococcales bacterium]